MERNREPVAESELQVERRENEAGADAGGISKVFHRGGNSWELLVCTTREIGNGSRRSHFRINEAGEASAREIPRSVEGHGCGYPHAEAGHGGGRQIPLKRNSPGGFRSRRTTHRSVRRSSASGGVALSSATSSGPA